MHTKQTVRIATVVAAVLLLGFVFVGPAMAAGAKSTAATVTAAPANESSATTAAAGTEAQQPAAEGAAAGAPKEIPHVVGHPSQAQLTDLRNAWASIPGYDLLLVSILGLVVTVGIVVFAAFKQSQI